MKCLVSGGMYRRLVYGVVGEWKDIQNASI